MSETGGERPCPTCGEEVPADARLCPSCSSILRSATAPTAADAGPPPSPPGWSAAPQVPPSTTPPAWPGAGPSTGAAPRHGPYGARPVSGIGAPGATWPTSGPAPKPKSRIPAIIGAGVVAAVVLFVTITFVSRNDGRSEGAAPSTGPTTTAGPTTTVPRNEQPTELEDYCPGTGAWPEVPPYDPSAPSQVYFNPNGDGLNDGGPVSGDGNGQDAMDGQATRFYTGPREGGTVLSPEPDAVEVTSDRVTGVRTVACVDFHELKLTGQQCNYGSGILGSGEKSTHELAVSVWNISVYELHSGTRLTGGQIESPADTCPEQIMVRNLDEPVHFAVTNQAIVNWLASKFPGGVPQP